MKVSGLYIYPVKGMRGLSVNSSTIVQSGLEHDRRYMLVDAVDGSFVSQRNDLVLCQMIVKREGSTWVVHYQGQYIAIMDDTFSTQEVEVELWDNSFVCNEVSTKHSAWFSAQLKKEVKLVVMPSQDTRIKSFKKEPYTTPVSFADGYPILTLGTKSLEHLNAKLSVQIESDRFRGNIIIETEKPHEEDLWSDFQIGDNCKFRNIKPCVRCEVITIDQSTGIKGKEPNTTLAKYRRFDNEIYFGYNVIVLEKGVIQVGDDLKLC